MLLQQEEEVLPEPVGREPGDLAAPAADDGPTGPSPSSTPNDALCASRHHAAHVPTSRCGETTRYDQSSTGCPAGDDQTATLKGACSRRQPASHQGRKGE